MRIPITLISNPSRKYMQQVALLRSGRDEQNAFRISSDHRREETCLSGAQLVTRSIRMLDLILLAIGLGFFALAVGYTIACDRL